MASAKISDDRLLERLTRVFQDHGYEGASLSLLAKATGLGRASLYHRFPGGKADMAEAVLANVDRWFDENVFAALRATGDPATRVRAATARLREFYDDGARACLLDTLAVGTRGAIRDHIGGSLRAVQGAMEKVARDAGLGTAEARRRATDALIGIEGALVVARGLGDNKPFLRVLRELPSLLTAGQPA